MRTCPGSGQAALNHETDPTTHSKALEFMTEDAKVTPGREDSLHPTVAILTCVLNARDAFQATAQSLPSELPNWLRWIVVDGGSTDGTLDLVRAETRVTSWVSEKDAGVYDAYNKALRLADTDFVHYLNAGDELHSDTLAIVSERLASNLPAEFRPQVICFSVEFVDLKGAVRVPRPPELSLRMSVPTPGVLFPRAALAESGGFDTGLRVSADYDALLRLQRLGIRFDANEAVLARFHSDGLSSRQRYLGLFENCVVQLRADPQAWRHCLFTMMDQAFLELDEASLPNWRWRLVFRVTRRFLWYK